MHLGTAVEDAEQFRIRGSQHGETEPARRPHAACSLDYSAQRERGRERIELDEMRCSLLLGYIWGRMMSEGDRVSRKREKKYESTSRRSDEKECGTQ